MTEKPEKTEGAPPPPQEHMRGNLWDQLVVLSGYHITHPPTPDHEFVQVCNGDLRKMVELMDSADQPITTGGSHASGCVEEFYDGDEAAYLRDTLKEVTKERDHFYSQFCIAWAALTPVSENEKRGMQRVLAILRSKQSEAVDEGNGFGPTWSARNKAFKECAEMLLSLIHI